MTTKDSPYLEPMVRQYLETLLWSEIINVPEDAEPKDEREGDPFDKHFGTFDIDDDTKKQAREDCAAFLARPEIEDIISRYDADDLGHDFALTRNGHGAGFWDGDYEAEPGDGEALTKACRDFAEVDFHLYTDAEGVERIGS